eukprot:gene1473-2834_t
MSCILFVTCQEWNGGQSEKNNKRGQLRKKKARRTNKRLDDALDRTSSLKSVAINYPINIFEGQSEWRTPAIFNVNLRDRCEADRSWTESSKAQDQEDIWLYENWFYGMQNGVIMESGALDGVLFSTSYFYEKVANWTGIHVEADPENYNNLIYNRPNAVNINGALCSESKPLHYSSEGVIPVRGFIEFMTPSFIKKWHGKIHNNITKIEDLRVVQCIPVKKLLNEINVKHVDIWILDVEGAEESVLLGTDFNTVHFNAVAMECDAHDIQKNSRKTDILEANGFKCQLVERNCMCRHEQYRPSASKEKTVLKMYDGKAWSKTYTNKGHGNKHQSNTPTLLRGKIKFTS